MIAWSDLLIDHDGSNGRPAYLLDHHVDLVSVLHVEVFGSVSFMDAGSVKQKSDIVGVQLYEWIVTLWRWQ